MKSSTIILILATLIFFGSQTDLQAQDTYDFAIVTFISPKDLSVNYSFKPFEKVDVGKENMKNGLLGPLLIKVSQMQDEGWEVFNTTAFASSLNMGNPTHHFYLRKKRQ